MKKTSEKKLKLKAQWITKNSSSRLYHLPVPIVGLTGGIASGKSTVAHFFREKNIPVIDADQLVKGIYQKAASIDFVAQHFKAAVNDGVINFKMLRELAFSKPENQKLLEDFIYAQMPKAFKEALSLYETPSFIVYDVPLLFEKHLDSSIDVSVCVYTPPAIQIQRLMARDHIDESLAQTILGRQMDVLEKKKRSNLCVENLGGLEELKENFERVLSTLLE